MPKKWLMECHVGVSRNTCPASGTHPGLAPRWPAHHGRLRAQRSSLSPSLRALFKGQDEMAFDVTALFRALALLMHVCNFYSQRRDSKCRFPTSLLSDACRNAEGTGFRGGLRGHQFGASSWRTQCNRGMVNDPTEEKKRSA